MVRSPDTMDEILTDIESQGVQASQIIDRHRTMLRSHQLDKKPIDLHAVIPESLALVAHDMRARQSVAATFGVSSKIEGSNEGRHAFRGCVVSSSLKNQGCAAAQRRPLRTRYTRRAH